MMRTDPVPDSLPVSLSDDPLTAALECHDPVLAIITGITGPSYRPLGEIMAFCGDQHVGSLSSGCIETDLARHAQQSLQDGPQVLRYGEGSPWFDLQLPCGGGLEITLIPRPCPLLLAEIAKARTNRQSVGLIVTQDLALRRCDPGPIGPTAEGFRILLVPPPRFLIFGQGPEAAVFTGLVHAAGYPHLLLTPEPATIAQAELKGASTRLLHWPALPTDLMIDERSAVVLFFHDHDWEPPILARALESEAFYIGAQGSLRARDKRLSEMRDRGVSNGLDRLKGPIGLIPSVRDPRILAVSVLAEVLQAAT
jgi:xanthine dehydrogenase accessory factor